MVQDEADTQFHIDLDEEDEDVRRESGHVSTTGQYHSPVSLSHSSWHVLHCHVFINCVSFNSLS